MKQVDVPNCICFSPGDDETEHELKYFDRITGLDYIKDSTTPFWAVYYFDSEIGRARLNTIGATPHSYIVYKGVKYENTEDVFKLQAVLENEKTERAINAL